MEFSKGVAMALIPVALVALFFIFELKVGA